jgi:hypothetical protein
VRYLGLAEAFIIAEAVTGIDAHDLVHVSRGDLLDSALHAPQAGFGDTDFFPSLAGRRPCCAFASQRITLFPTATNDWPGWPPSCSSN